MLGLYAAPAHSPCGVVCQLSKATGGAAAHCGASQAQVGVLEPTPRCPSQVRLKKVEMERRDAERLKRMEQELKGKHAANIAKRKKAEARISTALEHNAHLMRARKQAFEQKEAEAEARRREMEVVSVWIVWRGGGGWRLNGVRTRRLCYKKGRAVWDSMPQRRHTHAYTHTPHVHAHMLTRARTHMHA